MLTEIGHRTDDIDNMALGQRWLKGTKMERDKLLQPIVDFGGEWLSSLYRDDPIERNDVTIVTSLKHANRLINGRRFDQLPHTYLDVVPNRPDSYYQLDFNQQRRFRIAEGKVIVATVKSIKSWEGDLPKWACVSYKRNIMSAIDDLSALFGSHISVIVKQRFYYGLDPSHPTEQMFSVFKDGMLPLAWDGAFPDGRLVVYANPERVQR